MHGCHAGQDTLYGTVSIVRDPAYRRLWVSGLCSNMARWMDLVAVGWIALQMTGSPFMVAVAAFARSAPMMVLGPFAGIVADRLSRAHLLLVTQAGGAVIALAFLAMFALDAAGYWPLVALEGAFGILWSLDFPARRTALFSMLGAARVAQAVSLETVSMQIAKMVGPVVAGACLASLGPAACYAVMVAAFAVGLAATLGLRRRIEGSPAAHPAPILATLASGLAAAWASPIARAVLLLAVILHIWAAVTLSLESRNARPQGYRVEKHRASTYASRTMIWSGPLLALFIGYHLAHLTFGTVHPEFVEGDVYHNFISGFTSWPVSLLYITAMLALGLHLFHGTWSMLQTLGLSHPRWNPLRMAFAAGVTALVVIGNVSFPVAVLGGWLRDDRAEIARVGPASR